VRRLEGREGKGGDALDEESGKCGGALDERQMDGFDVKLEEESREARVGCELPFVVCDAELVCMQGGVLGAT
jgi:hypothetical protein